MAYCIICRRSIAKGGELRRFMRMSPERRKASLAATLRWYKVFKENHIRAMREQRADRPRRG